ncbi:DUF4365 domain-containing protein [Niabella aurantiaca]|uniref:DUF4365 domain-containing protein n=1 Tax=Niabella aurantiaca TaxID=379900 RepID=UPI00036E32AA|nr:DUF4365 domain-containing protein [Niabella aurantiaca]
MAINDKPKVDPSAMNSARSERKLNDWLNEDFGFILRKETPDKGCDYMCELMEGDEATNLKFPIQLKSIQSPELAQNSTYISYPMLTSRLGYMLNLLPTTGIIVLYDVSSEKLYYDFSCKIFDRINSDRGSGKWTRQEFVNIHVPIANQITEETIKNLHVSLKTIFDNAAKMQLANGGKYELPIVDIPGDRPFDWNNKEHLKGALKQFGLALLTHFDLAPVFHSLCQFTQQEIETNRDLLILACIAYGETGHFYQSDLFIRKLKRNFDLDEAERTMIDYAESKNLMQLGRITAADFIQRLEENKPQIRDIHNKLIMRINLQRLHIMDIKELNPTPPDITAEMGSIFETIEMSGLDEEIKDMLTLWNAEQESHLITHQLHLDFLSYTLSQTVNSDLPMEERRQMADRFISSETLFLKRVDAIYKRAFDKQHKHIMATALSLLARHFIYKLFAFISQGAPFPEPEEQHKKFFNFAFQAYQLFAEISQLKDAHYCLSNALEIMYSAKYYTNAPVDEDFENLMADKDRIEKHLMLDTYPLQIPILIEKVKKNAEEKKDNSLVGLSDNQIQQLAKVLFAPFRFPQGRFIHLLNELRATQLFQQRCSASDISLLYSYDDNPNNRYSEPVSFVLKNRTTGLESLPSKNIDALLTSWGF